SNPVIPTIFLFKIETLSSELMLILICDNLTFSSIFQPRTSCFIELISPVGIFLALSPLK
ncbi:MAG: hypothetical protein JXK16_13330, partial [Thiotrichales bacterium]|nr:hypothetical protein [Thiotrichales bacterium]